MVSIKMQKSKFFLPQFSSAICDVQFLSYSKVHKGVLINQQSFKKKKSKMKAHRHSYIYTVCFLILIGFCMYYNIESDLFLLFSQIFKYGISANPLHAEVPFK